MDITSWEDAGINWEKPQFSSAYEVFESIRLALLERMSVTGIDFEILSPAMKNIRYKRIYDVAREFHSNISSAISNFAKHTDNNGNWNNQEEIPNWTEKDILEEIGDAERVQVKEFEPLDKWVIQTYKVLNLLKWSKFEVRSGMPAAGNYMWLRESAYDDGETWSGAKNSFYSADWKTYGSSGAAGIIIQKAASPPYRVAAIRSKTKIAISKYHQCTREFWYLGYSYGQPINGIYFHNVITSGDWSYKYTLFKTENEGDGNEDGECFIFTDEEFNNTNFIEPVDGSGGLTAYVTYINTPRSVIISKYDGANGFKFLAKDEE